MHEALTTMDSTMTDLRPANDTHIELACDNEGLFAIKARVGGCLTTGVLEGRSTRVKHGAMIRAIRTTVFKYAESAVSE